MRDKKGKFIKGHKPIKGIEKGWFAKGIVPWNLGKKTPQDVKGKISLSKKGKFLGKDSALWKGNNVGYVGLHIWVKNNLGNPQICSNKNCFYPRKDARGKIIMKPTMYHWANISKKYKRELDDWIRLCPSCHAWYDGRKFRKSRYKLYQSIQQVG